MPQTPMRLLALYEVPEGVGLIEYNKHEFIIEETDDESKPYTISGLRVIRRSRYRQVLRFQIDAATAYLGYRNLTNCKLQFKEVE
jgi:hypothetical protein